MKVLITGGYGFLGSHLYDIFKTTKHEVKRFRSHEFNLCTYSETESLFQEFKPDVVYHLAARLGGIGDNRKNPAAYFEHNMRIGMNVFKAAQVFNVRRVINVGTVCSYPKFSPIPFVEENVWLGFPEET